MADENRNPDVDAWFADNQDQHTLTDVSEVEAARDELGAAVRARCESR